MIDTWSISDGLPGTVTDVILSGDGSLWIGTVAGFVRFDGGAFDVYDRGNVPNLPRRRVAALAPGRDSSLWIFTDRGHVVQWSSGAIVRRIDVGSDAVKPATSGRPLDGDDFWAWRIDFVYHVRGGELEITPSAEAFKQKEEDHVRFRGIRIRRPPGRHEPLKPLVEVRVQGAAAREASSRATARRRSPDR